MTQATYLATVAHGLLDTALDALSMERTGRRPPQRSNLSWGMPPADTFDRNGQLTVTLDPVGTGGSITHTSANPRHDSFIMPRATFTVTVMRPVPTGDGKSPPRAVDLDASAAGLLTDLWAVMTAIYSGIHDYTLYTGHSSGDEIKLGRTDMIPPQGGMGGFNVRIEVLLNDGGPTIGS